MADNDIIERLDALEESIEIVNDVLSLLLDIAESARLIVDPFYDRIKEHLTSEEFERIKRDNEDFFKGAKDS